MTVKRSYFMQAPQFRDETIQLAKHHSVKAGKAGVLVINYSDGSCFTHGHSSVPLGEVHEHEYGKHYAALETGEWV
jgi:hypothetical protein